MNNNEMRNKYELDICLYSVVLTGNNVPCKHIGCFEKPLS